MRHLREGAVVSAQVHGHKSLAPTAPGDLSDHRSISRESSRLVQLEGVDNPGENRRTLAAVCDHLLSRDVELLFFKVCLFFGFLLFVVEEELVAPVRDASLYSSPAPSFPPGVHPLPFRPRCLLPPPAISCPPLLTNVLTSGLRDELAVKVYHCHTPVPAAELPPHAVASLGTSLESGKDGRKKFTATQPAVVRVSWLVKGGLITF